MLVDDNHIDRYLHRRLLTAFNSTLSFLEFENGLSALTYLENNQNNVSQIPDMILLDIKMPVMNGFEFLDRYSQLPQQIQQKILIVILSSTFNATDIEKAKANQWVANFYQKPLTKTNVEEMVKMIINREGQM